MSASVCKVGFMLAERGMSQWCVPAGIAVGICCSSSGFFCQVILFSTKMLMHVSLCHTALPQTLIIFQGALCVLEHG